MECCELTVMARGTGSIGPPDFNADIIRFDVCRGECLQSLPTEGTALAVRILPSRELLNIQGGGVVLRRASGEFIRKYASVELPSTLAFAAGARSVWVVEIEVRCS